MAVIELVNKTETIKVVNASKVIFKTNVILVPLENDFHLLLLDTALLTVALLLIFTRFNRYLNALSTLSRLSPTIILGHGIHTIPSLSPYVRHFLTLTLILLPLCVSLALPIADILKVVVVSIYIILMMVFAQLDRSDEFIVTLLATYLLSPILAALWLTYVQLQLKAVGLHVLFERVPSYLHSKVEYIVEFYPTRFVLEFLAIFSIVLIIIAIFGGRYGEEARLPTTLPRTLNSRVVKLFVKLRNTYSNEVRQLVRATTYSYGVRYALYQTGNEALCLDMLGELGICVTTIPNTNRVLVYVDEYRARTMWSWWFVCMKVPQKLEKSTSTLYQTVFLLATDCGSALLNTLIVVDKVSKTVDVLYLRPEDINKPIEYLDLYTMGLVDNYEQYLRLRDKIKLEES